MNDASARLLASLRLILACTLFGSGPAFCDETPGETIDSGEATGAGDPYRVEVTKQIAYGEREDRSGRCDLYLPTRPGEDAPTPVVLAVHGGAWMSGDKWTMRSHASQLAARGIAVVSINYRLAPTHKFPKQLDDLRQALLWIVDHGEEHRFDLTRVALYGYSAGGHLVSLIGTLGDESWDSVQLTTEWKQDDPRWRKLPKVSAVLAGAPPTDFEGYPTANTAMVYFLGGTRQQKPDVYKAASPIAHVSKADPPIHLVHGDADLLVPINGSRRFLERSKETQSQTTLTVVPKQGHLLTFISPKMAETLIEFFVERLLDEEQSNKTHSPG